MVLLMLVDPGSNPAIDKFIYFSPKGVREMLKTFLQDVGIVLAIFSKNVRWHFLAILFADTCSFTSSDFHFPSYSKNIFHFLSMRSRRHFSSQNARIFFNPKNRSAKCFKKPLSTFVSPIAVVSHTASFPH